MVLQYEYWPSVQWMETFVKADEVWLEQWGNYQKQSNANRCKILSDKGVITLSIPLIGGREQKTLLNEIQIDNSQRWPVQQLRSLKSCYGKSAFFDHYFPLIEKLLTQRFDLLIDLNEQVLRQLTKWLKITQESKQTKSFQPFEISDKSKRPYLAKPYLQVFSAKAEFVPNLSVLDALFCLGPQVKDHL